MNDITVLIVDDESRMRKLIKDFLMQKNYKILEAEDGEEALRIFQENEEKIREVNEENEKGSVYYERSNTGHPQEKNALRHQALR